MEPIKILFAHRDYVVCVKPAGVLSQNGKPGQDSMVSLLEKQLGGTIYPVHRLDRETGGVMVYARTSVGATRLSRQIQQGQLRKEYLAVLRGTPKQPQGVLEDILFHDARRNKSYVVRRVRKGARQAKLSYQVLATREDQTLVQIRLFTGRTHQIRVQFSSRGLPLVGDGTYGGGRGGLCLWSCRLEIPTGNGQPCSFVEMPERLGPFSELPLLVELAEEKEGPVYKFLDKTAGVE